MGPRAGLEEYGKSLPLPGFYLRTLQRVVIPIELSCAHIVSYSAYTITNNGFKARSYSSKTMKGSRQ
jgi:hypothetical protein